MSNQRILIAGVALALALVAASVAGLRYFRARPASAPSVRLEVPAAGIPHTMAIAPDGGRLAYAAPGPDGKDALWVRSLQSLDARMLAGTEGADLPGWSPDGRFVVFAAEGRLGSIDVAGGPPKTLTTIQGEHRGSTWNRDGVIVFSANSVLHRVSAAGGESTPVTELDGTLGETFHATPWFLPDGQHFLYLAWSTQADHRAIYVGSLDSKARTRLLGAGSKAIYVSPGFILFMREGTLMARPFDAGRLQFTGDAVPVAERVSHDPASGAAAFYASDDGTLLYRGTIASSENASRQWVWMDRSGKTSGRIGPSHNAQFLNMSPDGKRIAFDESVGGSQADVWIYDIDRDVRTRLTTDSAADRHPVWSPDGSRVVFWSTRAASGAPGGRPALPGGPAARGLRGLIASLFEKPTNDATPEQAFLQADAGTVLVPWDWSRDGRVIVGQRFAPTAGPTASDLWVVPVSGDRKPVPYLATSFSEAEPALSPDGRWLAYVSNETGSFQIFVRPFPAVPQGKWQISTKGGHFPRWKGDSREVYYLDSDRQLVAVSIKTEPGFEVGESTRLFMTPFVFPANAQVNIPYDVTADGQRFLLSAPFNPAETPLTVVTNWFVSQGR